MAITTTTQIAGPVNVVYSRRLIERAKPRCVYFTGSRPGDVLPSHNGSFTMKFRQYDNVTPSTTALTELSGTLSLPTRAGTQLSVTDTTAAVSKYGQHMFLTEETDLVNFNMEAAERVDVFAHAGGRSLNYLQRNILEDNATLIYMNGSADGDVSDPISLAAIRNAINTLDRNSAIPISTARTSGSSNEETSPILPAYRLICHSDVAVDVAALPGFKSVTAYQGQTAIEPGEFGYLESAGYSVRCVSSPEGSIDTGSGNSVAGGVRSTSGAADLYTTIIMGENFHGAFSLDSDLIRETYMAGDMIPGMMLISKPMGSSGVADPLNEIASVGYKAWHGGTLLDSNMGRGIRSAASLLQ